MRDESFIVLQGFDSFELRLGDELRGERASLGKSLLDVQRELKIKAAYVDAIENCDASVFPNPGFVAGYVRAYSRYLNLDADAVYRRFCAESGFEGVNSDLGVGRPKRAAEGRPAGRSLTDESLERSRFRRVAAPGFSLAALSGLGSVLVLMALVVTLGYGGWYLLKDIQRIGFAPVAQLPAVLREPDVLPPIAETIGAVPPESHSAEPHDLALNNFYAPRLIAPDVEPRDGPIAAIDPDESGLFPPGSAPEPVAAASLDPIISASSDATLDPPPGLADPLSLPPEVAAPAPKGVEIVARDLAWVRVYLANGAIIFEKTLTAGESYEVPADVEAPLLRAGNSGSVFLRVGGELFGPLGRGTGVARNISLVANDVAASWPRAAAEAAPVQSEQNAALPAPLPTP